MRWVRRELFQWLILLIQVIYNQWNYFWWCELVLIFRWGWLQCDFSNRNLVSIGWGDALTWIYRHLIAVWWGDALTWANRLLIIICCRLLSAIVRTSWWTEGLIDEWGLHIECFFFPVWRQIKLDGLFRVQILE